jgi:hypothetical protein
MSRKGLADVFIPEEFQIVTFPEKKTKRIRKKLAAFKNRKLFRASGNITS